MKSRTRIFLSAILAGAAAVGIAACSVSDTFDDGLAEARSAIDNNDLATAQKICDGLYSHIDNDDLSARQLGTLSILMMELSNSNETDKQADNVAAATNCYLAAFTQNADSAEAFYASRSSTDPVQVATLYQIVRGVTGERSVADNDSTPGANPIDSIAINGAD